MKKMMRKIVQSTLCIMLMGISFIPPYHISKVNAADYPTYGIVNFRTKDCNTNTNFKTETGATGYTNGCYGADAAFLGIENGLVKFKLSGVVGYVNPSEVEVRNMDPEIPATYQSSYTVQDGVIKHTIQLDVNNYKSGNSITIGRAPSGIANGTYYSYDGIYFYPANLNGLKTMIDDYKAGNTKRAVNANNPYYNYYQYLPSRTLSNYQSSDIAVDFSDWNSKMTSYPAAKNQSQLYGEQQSFIEYQGQYGINAMMILGLAKNESAMGRSQIAFNKNNLFGIGAYDSNTGAAKAFATARESIRYFSKNLISEGYLDPGDYGGRYHGGHFGNKGSGFNIKYASDPFWGEKEASYYYAFDAAYGFQDYNKYKLAVKTNNGNYAVKKEASFNSTQLYLTGKDRNVPFVVLDTITNNEGTWYKVQTDPTLVSGRNSIQQDNGAYDYNNNYGYIEASAIGYVSQGSALKNRYAIDFNPNGGTFPDGETSTKRLTVEEYVTPEVSNPTRNGYIFNGWSETVTTAQENKTYVAKWRSLNPTTYQITFDADGGVFSDGKTTKVVSTLEGEQPNTPLNPTKTGYKFIGWDSKVESATSNKTYKAVYEKIKEKFEITFDANGGTFSDGKTINVQTVEEDTTPTTPSDPTRVGYRFTGWDSKIEIATQKKTYQATWEKIKTYAITFKADGGTFTNKKDTLVIDTEENTKPNVENPVKEGYIFQGWTPDLEEATEAKTYTATWKKGTIEELLTKKDGIFYFNYLKQEDGKLKLQGYQTIQGIQNNLSTDIHYQVVFENMDTGDKTVTKANRITNKSDIPKPVYSPDGLDYTYSWFDAEIDVDDLENGNYKMYLLAYSDEYYVKSLINNKTYNQQATSVTGKNKAATINNNYDTSASFVELKVRDDLLANKNGSYIYNQYDKYTTFEFSPDSKLHLRGNSYSYGMNLASNTSVTRSIIFEGQDTYKTYKKSLGSITNGNYQVFLPVSDSLDKTRAWYDKTVDISDIPTGKYTIYLTTTSNITDIAELTEKIGRNLDNVKATINGKKYTFTINKSRGNRIEMTVK